MNNANLILMLLMCNFAAFSLRGMERSEPLQNNECLITTLPQEIVIKILLDAAVPREMDYQEEEFFHGIRTDAVEKLLNLKNAINFLSTNKQIRTLYYQAFLLHIDLLRVQRYNERCSDLNMIQASIECGAVYWLKDYIHKMENINLSTFLPEVLQRLSNTIVIIKVEQDEKTQKRGNYGEFKMSFYQSLYKKQFEMLQRIISQGANINAPLPYYNECPLNYVLGSHIFTEYDQNKVAKYLLDNGAEMDAKSQELISKKPKVKEFIENYQKNK